MQVYRIVKLKKRTKDLSGLGAFLEGGRWNGPGSFALYTSENPSLALLEVLVHLDESDIPPGMFVMEIEVDDQKPITKIEVEALPKGWRIPDNIQLKQMGDAILVAADSIGFSVPSAVLPGQYNIILNPSFPGFLDCVRILSVEPLEIDQRLKEYEAIGIY
ncbi:MAG: RES domain-containing protein [Sphingobacteriales bacterium]|nr:MAG: RES domain-containing protein [Sphingobacteriales bacterium]